MCDVINLHALGDLRQPADLHKAHMIGMGIVLLIGGRIREFHRKAKGERVLGADLPQALEMLHPRDACGRARVSEKIQLSGGGGGMFESEDNGVATHGRELRLGDCCMLVPSDLKL